MKNHSSENYLDQLLNSINGETEKKKPKENQEELDPLESFERELFGESYAEEALSDKDEEDFLREFEAELLTDDIPRFGEDHFFDQREKKVTDARGMEETDASIDAMLNHMDSFEERSIPEAAEMPEVDDMAEFDGPIPEEPMPDAGADEMQAASMQSLDEAMDSFSEDMSLLGVDANVPLTEDGEVDLSGMDHSDLMDILSGQDGMSDLGDMLSAESSGRTLDGMDQIGSFAEGEMEAQQLDSTPDADEDGKGKRKRKKKKDKKREPKSDGFLSKLTKLLFGDEEKESDDILIQSAQMDIDVSQLSDENLQILRDLEGPGGDSMPVGNDKKKKSKKKAKSKEPKAKKAPKPKKPPKPKKEKPPKEKDNTPPLPKGPVRAIVVMVASLFGLVLLGVNLLGYQASINEAKALFKSGSYADAYAAVSGVKIKEKDIQFYNQLCALAPTSSEYNTYLIFSSSGKDVMALDALICAYGRYDVNKERAREYGCTAELEILGSKVIRSLLEDYDMTGTEALEMYRSRTRKQYTILLHEKCQRLGLE